MKKPTIKTPDGRYIVVDGKLWRTVRPDLPSSIRLKWVAELMSARRAIRDAKGNESKISDARSRVQIAKVALGERGPVWWTDGAPDYTRHAVANTPYAAWYREEHEQLTESENR